MNSNFNFKGQKSISFGTDAYVYSVIAPERDSTIFAASGSNREIHLYDLHSFQGIAKLSNSDGQITDMSFVNVNSNETILSCYSTGDICLWDLRTCEPSLNINCKMPLLSTAMNKSGIVCAGTEIVDEDAFLYGWDIRHLSTPIIQFNDSFGDDISVLKFNPNNQSCLVSASVDGLACIFDLSKNIEDESLCNVINALNPISNFNFFGPSLEYLWLSTCVEGISIWNINEGSMFHNDSILQSDMEYIIDLVYDSNAQRLFMINGDHNGKMFLCQINMNGIHKMSSLSGGHTATIRTAWLNFKNNFIISGGEDSALSLWACCEDGIS
jgi:WD40 repeat protein